MATGAGQEPVPSSVSSDTSRVPRASSLSPKQPPASVFPWLTLYAFSLENNLRRPRAEVSFLMMLLKSYLESNLQRMMDNNVRIRYIGRTHELPPRFRTRCSGPPTPPPATPARP